MKTKLIAAAMALLVPLIGGTPAMAQSQSVFTKPLRIIVPYAPGGGTDLFSRTIAEHLAKKFGQPVIVENKPGANTLIGHRAIASAAPDGHTFGMISSAMTSLPATTKAFTLDPVRDFTPITQLVTGAYAVVVHPSVPVNSMEEFVAYARRNPGKLAIAAAGGGIDLSISIFKSKANVDMLSLQYKGIAPARLALLANEVQVAFDVIGVAKELAAAGKLKLLAVTGPQRDPAVPDVPTVAQAGVPGFVADFWWGYGGPAGMPAAAVREIHAGIVEAMATPTLQNQIKANGNVPVGNTPQEFAKLIAADIDYWLNAAKAANITPE